MNKKLLHFRLFLSFVAMLVIFTCCKKETKESESPVLEIDLAQAQLLKDNVKSINVMTLKDSSFDDFPGVITRVEWFRDTMFVMDGWKSRGVYKYAPDGQMVGTYTKLGQGPGEYIHLNDISLSNGEIVLLADTDKLIRLDKDLNLIEDGKSEKGAAHVMITGDGIWYDRGNNSYHNNAKLVFYADGKDRKEVLTIPKELENATFQCYETFAKAGGDTVLYVPPMESKIYSLVNGTADVLCELDFKGSFPNVEDWADRTDIMSFMHFITEKGLVHNVNLYTEKNKAMITFITKDGQYLYLFDWDTLSPKGLYFVDKASTEGIGTPVGLKNGAIVFGSPDKLMLMYV